MAKEALALAQRSAKRALGRLQFFRYAFGAAGGEPDFGAAEARPVALSLLSSGEIAIDWPESKAVELPVGVGRLLLNLTLLAVECLPRGGSIRVVLGPNRVGIDATGPQARVSGDTKAAITGALSPVELSARTILGYYVTQLVTSLGGRLDLADEGAGEIRFQMVFTPTGA
jgi:histidine phosphotransferase ChpT